LTSSMWICARLLVNTLDKSSVLMTRPLDTVHGAVALPSTMQTIADTWPLVDAIDCT
jgi:hypothetical protein